MAGTDIPNTIRRRWRKILRAKPLRREIASGGSAWTAELADPGAFPWVFMMECLADSLVTRAPTLLASLACPDVRTRLRPRSPREGRVRLRRPPPRWAGHDSGVAMIAAASSSGAVPPQCRARDKLPTPVAGRWTQDRAPGPSGLLVSFPRRPVVRNREPVLRLQPSSVTERPGRGRLTARASSRAKGGGRTSPAGGERRRRGSRPPSARAG